MNKDLEYLINSGDIVGKRTLRFYLNDITIAYTTEYKMNSPLGPMKFYVTWKDENCDDAVLLDLASIRMYAARARLYFPAYMDTRIPPPNRVGYEELAAKWGVVGEYDKFEWAVKTKCGSPIKRGLVEEIEPTDCSYDFINEIEKIVAEYERVL